MKKKRNMAPSIQIPSYLENKNILVDTNFLIDSYSQKEEFAKFISDLKRLKVALVTIKLVKYEFVRAKTKDVIEQKEDYFRNLIDAILPDRLDIIKYNSGPDSVIELMKKYNNSLEGVSIVDLMLGVTLKRYFGLYLLTRDHQDFPTNIFTREEVFHIESTRNIRTYGLYSYKPEEKKIEEEIPF